MKMKSSPCVAALVACCSLSSSIATTVFLDDFNAGIAPGWSTDRYAPNSVDTVGGTLNLTISNADSAANRPGAYSSAFYNTQGIGHAADVTGLWTLSGSLLVSSDVVSGTAGGRRADLWGRSANIASAESSADYYIMGYRSFDPADPFNASAASISSAWRVWDSDIGWVDISAPVTTGWHDLDVTFTGSVVEYRLDNTLVYSDVTLTPDAAHFTSLIAQAYNFGNAPAGDGDFPAPGSYVASFDNISVTTSVPDGGHTLLMFGGGVAAIFVIRRKLQLAPATS